MATITFNKGQGAVFTIEAASVTGKTYQLKDFANAEIAAANKGFFWKVTALNYNATQNTVDKPHVGTDEQDTIATTKTYEGTIEMDLYKADGDVTLVGTTTTFHAINPVSVYKQVIAGDGETYTGKIYIGCPLKANAANGNEDHADPDNKQFVITLEDVIFTSIPFSASPNEITSLSIPVKFKSSDIA